MRKGRSSRRSRSSRPLIGATAPSVDELATEIGPSEPPHLVVVVPPSYPPPSEGALVDASSETASSLETPEAAVVAEPATRAKKDADPEPAASVSSAGEHGTRKAMNLASTLAFGSATETSAVETRNGTTAFASTLAFGSVSDVETKAMQPATQDADTPAKQKQSAPIGKSKKKNKRAELAEAEAEAMALTSADAPTNDVADEQFFSDGDVAARAIQGLVEDEPPHHDKAKRKSEPAVVERRARLARYVKWAVGGAAIVCLVALARTTLSTSTSASIHRPAGWVAVRPPITTAVTPTPGAASPNAVEAVVAATTPAVAVAPEDPSPKAAELAAAPVAATSVEPAPTAAAPNTTAPSAVVAPSAAVDPAAVPVAEPAVVVGDAKEEKAKARSLLERRKIADAIEAGERSVKLDPADGEAWLILGAAYQEKGNLVAARRAYGACVKEAKTGPRHECAKMLR